MFALQYIDETGTGRDYAALDDASGGYPYRTPIHRAKFWRTLDECLDYHKHFNKELRIVKVTFVVELIE